MTEEVTRSARVRSWLAGRSLRQILLAVGAVILLVSGAFGGLKQAEADQRDTLEAGRPHLSEPIDLTIKRVAWSDDLGEVIGPSEYGRYLLVIADVSSNQDRSVDGGVVREALRFTGLQGFSASQVDTDPVRSEDAEPQVIVTDDRTRLDGLGPGLTYEVAFIWQQQASEPLPTSVRLLTRSHGFRQGTFDDAEGWFDIADDAVGRFPVTEFGAS